MSAGANLSLTKADWEAQRETIEDLYCKQGKNLGNLMKFMEENYQFEASKSQYELRLRQWGIHKNHKQDERRIISAKVKHRKQQGKKTEVIDGSQLIPPETLRKHMSRYPPPQPYQPPLHNAPTPEGFIIRTPPAASIDVAVQPPVSSDLVSRSQSTSVGGTPQMQTVDMSLVEPPYDVELGVQNDNIDLLWLSSYIKDPPQLQQPITVVNGTTNHASEVVSMATDSLSPSSFLSYQSGSWAQAGSTSTSVLNYVDDPYWWNTFFRQPWLGSLPFSSVNKFISVQGMSQQPNSTNWSTSLLPENLMLHNTLTDLANAHVPYKALLPNEWIGTADIIPYDGVSVVIALKLATYQVSNDFPGAPTDFGKLRRYRRNILQVIRSYSSMFTRSVAKLSTPTFLEKLFILAVEEGDSEMVEILLESGLDPTKCNGSCLFPSGEFSPLETCCFAIATGVGNLSWTDSRTKIVKILLSSKPQYDHRYRIPFTLHSALSKALRGNASYEAIELLVGAGAPVSNTIFTQSLTSTDVLVHTFLNDVRTKSTHDSVTDGWKLSQLELCLSSRKDLLEQYMLWDDFNDTSELIAAVRFASSQNDITLLQAIIIPANTIIDTFIITPNILKNELRRILRVYREHQETSEYSTDFILNYIAGAISRDDETIVSWLSQRVLLSDNQRKIAVAEILERAAERNSASILEHILPTVRHIGVDNFTTSLNKAISVGQENAVVILMKFVLQECCSSPSHRQGYYTACTSDLQRALDWRNWDLLWLFLNTDMTLEKSEADQLIIEIATWGNSLILEDLLSFDKFRLPSGNSDALAIAAGQDDIKKVRLLVRYGAKSHYKEGQPSALENAIRLGNEEMVRCLLNQSDPDDYGAILASEGHIHLRELLITSVKQKITNATKGICLMQAIDKGDCEKVKTFLDAGIINKQHYTNSRYDLPHSSTRGYRQYPLRFAVDNEKIAVVELLLANHADPNLIEHVLYPGGLLGINITQKNIEIIRLLISHNANINPPLSHGLQQTPLQVAVDTGDTEIVQFLLEHNAAVNAEPARRRGATALQIAAMKGYLHMACLLLEYGANVFAPAAKIDGRTAFEGAAEHGRIDMVRLLWNATWGKGFGEEQHRYAIEFAEMRGHSSVAQYIRELVQSLEADGM